MTQPTIFLASSAAGLEITRALALQLRPYAVMIWSEEAFRPGMTITESLAELAARADFAVFVVTADDGGPSLGNVVPRANAIFKLGFFAGHIGLARVFLVMADRGTMTMPSDLSGIMIMHLSLPERTDTNLAAAVGPVAAAIREVVSKAGGRVDRSPEFFSCFISYSWDDKEFAVRLYDDLQKVGVRCWLDAREMKSGELIREQIDRAIQVHDKVLLVLSKASIGSSWVRQEIRNASALEHKRQKTVLFPVQLDNSVLSVEDQEEISRIRERFIIDFSGWKDRTQYQRAFSRLVRDLTISAAVEGGGHR